MRGWEGNLTGSIRRHLGAALGYFIHSACAGNLFTLWRTAVTFPQHPRASGAQEAGFRQVRCTPQWRQPYRLVTSSRASLRVHLFLEFLVFVILVTPALGSYWPKTNMKNRTKWHNWKWCSENRTFTIISYASVSTFLVTYNPFFPVFTCTHTHTYFDKTVISEKSSPFCRPMSPNR